MGFFSKAKEVEVTVFDKAKLAVLGVQSALAVFSRLVEELNTANTNLKSVVSDCEQVITEHQDLKTKAEGSIQEYETLLNNLEKILGGKQ